MSIWKIADEVRAKAAKSKSQRMVSAGPCVVNNYPVSAWARMNLPTGMSMEDVWKLCGPMVDRNLSRRPLWEVFCMVYLEALNHGSQAAQRVTGLELDATGKPFATAGEAKS